MKAAAEFVLRSDDPAEVGARVRLPEAELWPKYRETLARVLTRPEWTAVVLAMHSLDQVRDARREGGDIVEAFHRVDRLAVKAHTAIKHRFE